MGRTTYKKSSRKTPKFLAYIADHSIQLTIVVVLLAGVGLALNREAIMAFVASTFPSLDYTNVAVDTQNADSTTETEAVEGDAGSSVGSTDTTADQQATTSTDAEEVSGDSTPLSDEVDAAIAANDLEAAQYAALVTTEDESGDTLFTGVVDQESNTLTDADDE